MPPPNCRKEYGITPDTATADNFADGGKTYYTGYLAAAKGLGISGGNNGALPPEAATTRAQMAQGLYNLMSK